MRVVVSLLACAALGFQPPPVAPRRPLTSRPAADDLSETQQNLLDSVAEGIERHPVLVEAVATKVAEDLGQERPMDKNDGSFAARLENFFVGLVRHPAMLWATFIRVSELVEEELVEAGGEDQAKQAEKIRQVRIAAEAVRESRKI